MSPPHILLLGAHGKVALQLLPLLLARPWSVTALIRDPAQTDDILNTRQAIPSSAKNPGTLNVLVESIESVKTSQDASNLIAKAKGVNWVVWAAGAGGKGGPERTNAIDRDASIAFAHSVTHNPSITKYLLISAISSRRHPAPWWSEGAAASIKKSADSIAVYSAAKLAADEALTYLAEERKDRDRKDGKTGDEAFRYVILRPGLLTDDPATGKVTLGKTHGYGSVTRGDVAAVAAELLANEVDGWFDLLEGNKSVEEEVNRVIQMGENAIEGEKLEEMKESLYKAAAKW